MAPIDEITEHLRDQAEMMATVIAAEDDFMPCVAYTDGKGRNTLMACPQLHPENEQRFEILEVMADSIRGAHAVNAALFRTTRKLGNVMEVGGEQFGDRVECLQILAIDMDGTVHTWECSIDRAADDEHPTLGDWVRSTPGKKFRGRMIDPIRKAITQGE